jgi:hypothetical protein
LLKRPQVSVSRHGDDNRCALPTGSTRFLNLCNTFELASTAAQQLNALFSPVRGAALSELALLASGPLMVDIENILIPKGSGFIGDGSTAVAPNPEIGGGGAGSALFHVMLGHDITICPLVASLRLRACDGASLSQDWPPFAR